MYNVNFKKFAKGLLPFSLRGNVASLVEVLTHPFRVLHHRFSDYRLRKLWFLRYNCTVGSMQAALNDYFADILQNYADGRPILIDDGDSVNGLLVYPEAEHLPILLGCVAVTSHTTWGTAPFLVKIPNDLEDAAFIDDMIKTVKRLVDIFKIAGTHYEIIFY